MLFLFQSCYSHDHSRLPQGRMPSGQINTFQLPYMGHFVLLLRRQLDSWEQ